MYRLLSLKSYSLFPGWPLPEFSSPTAETVYPQNMLHYLPRYYFTPFVVKFTLNRLFTTVYTGPQRFILLLWLHCPRVKKDTVRVRGLAAVNCFLSLHNCTYVFFLYSSNLWFCRGFLCRSNKRSFKRWMALCLLLAVSICGSGTSRG